MDRLWPSWPSLLGSLRARLIAAFAGAMGVTLAAGAISIAQLREISHELEILDEAWVPAGREAARMGALLEATPAGAAADLAAPIGRARAAMEALLGAPVEDRAGLGGCLRRLDLVEDAQQRYNASVKSTSAEGASAGIVAGPGIDPAVAGRARAVLAGAIGGFADCADRRTRSMARRARSAADQAERIAWAAAAASLLAGAALMLALRRSLQPIEDLTSYVRRLIRWEREGGPPPDPAPIQDAPGLDEVALLAEALRRLPEAAQARDRAQERLERAGRLAMAGELLASVTHEIRNPLNALSLHGELLDELIEEDGQRGEGDERRLILRQMLDQIRRIDQISARYLELARPHRPVVERCDPLRVCQDVAGFLAPDLARRGLTVTVEGGEGAGGPVVAIDAGALRQILTNLLRNAAEAGAASAQVSVRAAGPEAAGDLGAEGTGGGPGGRPGLWLEVGDDGPGMGAEVAARVFEPFFTTRAGGTGLGLAITRQLAEGAGGAITCEPGAGGAGCRFRVYLPDQDITGLDAAGLDAAEPGGGADGKNPDRG